MGAKAAFWDWKTSPKSKLYTGYDHLHACLVAGTQLRGDRELALAILTRTARAAAAAGAEDMFFRNCSSVAMTATICPIWR
jgi:hypothetical protein